MPKQLFKQLSFFSGGLAICCFVPDFFLMAHFYAIGETKPNLVTNKIFPIQAHGTLYVTPEQGHLFYALLIGFGVFALGSFLLDRAAMRVN